jgi:hypothetical protein
VSARAEKIVLPVVVFAGVMLGWYLFIGGPG